VAAGVRSLVATSVAAGLAVTATAGLSARLPGLIPQLDEGLMTLIECALAAGDGSVKTHLFPFNTVKDRRLARMSHVTGRAGLGIRI
jgi:hypothetical protein